MVTKQLPGSVYAPDGSLYITLTDGAGNLTPSSGGSGAVSSVFTRTGAVVAVSGDYSVGQVTGAAPSASPTFTGTVTMPDSSLWTSSGLSSLVVTSAGAASSPSIGVGSASTGVYSSGSTGLGFSVNGVNVVDFGITQLLLTTLASGLGLRLSNVGATFQLRNGATILSSPASATLQLGAADSSSPTSQTIKIQSGSGTNIAGVNSAIIGSLGTGNTTSGNIIFQVGGPTGVSGSVAIAATTAMTINAGTQKVSHAAPISFPLYTVSSVAALTGSATGDVAVVTNALAPTFLGSLTGGGTSVVLVVYNGTAWIAA